MSTRYMLGFLVCGLVLVMTAVPGPPGSPFRSETFEHVDDEFHRRVVVVEDEHAVHARLLGLRLGLGDDRGAGAARLAFQIGNVRARGRRIPSACSRR